MPLNQWTRHIATLAKLTEKTADKMFSVRRVRKTLGIVSDQWRQAAFVLIRTGNKIFFTFRCTNACYGRDQTIYRSHHSILSTLLLRNNTYVEIFKCLHWIENWCWAILSWDFIVCVRFWEAQPSLRMA